MNNEKVKSLQQARDKIDQIDVALIELIASRQFYVDQVMRHKQTVEDVQSPQRVKEVIEKVRALAVQHAVDPDMVERLYHDMIQHFIQRELKEFRP
ncbi:chorismate mutase [Acinetobacter sp. PW68]|uniref:chorismate mutase n=1 Tax=Acinetobacter sp. PW68 TaxID=2865162 RepID=UPI001E56CAA4|nr:chorismate mutase [Acinetobacter sp. PW68]MCD0186833.1 chorismate mutase [Acinetobacter sp. PW68]